MAISDKTTLQTQIASLFPDNNTRQISAVDLRTHQLDALDSQVIQRQFSVSQTDATVNLTEADIDQNLFHIFNTGGGDQTINLPAITAAMIGRSLIGYTGYVLSQTGTIVPNGSDVLLVSRPVKNRNMILLRVLDATTWTLIQQNVDAAALNQVLQAESTADQDPSGLDSALQIEFGPEQLGDDIDLAADGTITIKTSGTYTGRITANFSRPTSNGNAFFFIRVLKDGVQVGNPVALEQTDDDISVPIFLELIVTIDELDVPVDFTVECIRDSQGGGGIDSGGLRSLTSTNSWGSTPSARITVTKF